MSVEFITLILILWLPIGLVAMFNLLWDLHFWQNIEYDITKLYSVLRWDFEISHRPRYRILAKLILFFLIFSLVLNIDLIISLIGIFLAYTLWIVELYEIIEKLLARKFLPSSLEPRSYAILATGAIVLSALPIVTAIPFVTSTESILNYGQISVLGQVSAGGVSLIPDIYIYLAFSTLLGLTYDLSSPLISTLLVLLTSPLNWIYNEIIILKARNQLQLHSKLLVIGIIGSYGKTTTKQLLQETLKKDFQVRVARRDINSVASLTHSILKDIDHTTEIFIVDYTVYKESTLRNVTKLLPPNLLILTGLDQSSIGIWKDQQNLLNTLCKAIANLSPGGTVILNGDDELLLELANRTDNKEVFFSIETDVHELLSGNKLELDFYKVDRKKVNKRENTFSFSIHRQQSDLSFTLPYSASRIPYSILAAIATATELGISAEVIQNKLVNFSYSPPEFDQTPGKNHTFILHSPNSKNIKLFEYGLETLKDATKSERIFVTTGLKHAGKHKINVYKYLTEKIAESADLVITFDADLAKTLSSVKDLEVETVATVDNLLYKLESRIEQKNAILIVGNIAPYVIPKLSSVSY